MRWPIDRSRTNHRARLAARIALLTAVLGMLVVPSAVARATFPGTNGRIAFADWDTGQIYAVNPDGTGLVQLTHARSFAGDPSWSPDGTQIVFEKPYKDRQVLWLMDADGSNKHMIADQPPNTYSFSAVFTPDGTHVVYTRCRLFEIRPGDRAFTCRIFSIATDGTDRVGITTTDPPLEVFDFEPMVSSDGSTIVFTRHNQNYDGIIGQLYTMDIDGSNQLPITAPRYEAWYADWSPDDTHIVFTSNSNRYGSNGFVMNADGTNIVRLTTTPFPHNDYQLMYSPDGTQLVFASDRNLESICCDTQMFVMNADGTNQTPVDVGGLPSPHDFSWGTAPLLTGRAASTPRIDLESSATRVVARCSFLPGALRKAVCG
jgi:Tol biopolymer transport system component